MMRSPKSAFCSILLLPAALAAAGCGSPPPEPDETPPVHAPLGGSVTGDPRRRYENDDLWIDARIPGSPSIKLVLSEQRAYLYKGGRLAGMAPISTGGEGNPTATGQFRIIEMDPEHKSSLYGNYVDADGKIIQADVDTSKDPKPPGTTFDGASMAHFMRFNGGTGMHEGFMPGYPDSHGCIRMPGWFAAALYKAVSVGTPVTVVR
jgi:lipoprotein-anchoring transpeptidase ErfK/SrfK